MPKPVPNTQTGSLTDNQHGTNDTLILDPGSSPAEPQKVLSGDAFAMVDDSRGGNDTLIGGANAHNSLFGDAREMYDNARGGNDTLIGGANTGNFFFGDAFTLHDNARGGNDTLIGGAFSNNNTLFGDAVAIFDNGRGGDDTLIAGDAAAVNFLVGDANQLDGNARGGNDTLISGTGTDHMWGDAQSITAPAGTVVTGADTFVFAPGNGNDDVNDFRQNDHDRIDVSAWGFHSLADMTIIDAGADTRIEFDLTNSVTLVGLGDPGVLHAADFIFA